MELLTVEQIAAGLDSLRLNRRGVGPPLVRNTGRSVSLEALGQVLQIELPKSFASIIMEYDFSNFALGPVTFRYGIQYSRFVALNTQGSFAWWGAGPRPNASLYVGGTDGHLLLLDADTGQLTGNEFGSPDIGHTVASGFETFFRALGSLRIWGLTVGRHTVIPQIMAMIGADPATKFWMQLSYGQA
jgi:hypothetical protein